MELYMMLKGLLIKIKSMEDYRMICCIFNIAPHYRESIYKAMALELGCDFYFGDKLSIPIKKMNYDKLNCSVKEIHNVIFGKFYWQRKCIRLIFKPYKYYILDGEPYCLSSWVILFLSKIIGKKTIAWTHGWYGRENYIKRIVKKVFYSLFTNLLIYNNYSIRLMEKEGFSSKKMYCIANSLDSDYQADIRKSLKISEIFTSHFKNSNPIILYIGRIQKSKKIELLIDCIEKMYYENIKVNLVIVGADVEGIQLEKIVKKKGLTHNVWFYGSCYDEKIIGNMFYNASICVSPGNVGLTAIHALSYGCPIITHNNYPYQGPEFESIITGITGDFFPEDNLIELAHMIEKWINKSKREREEIKKKAFETIDKKWNIHYQIKILKKVLSNKN